jgi:hypothetical protein
VYFKESLRCFWGTYCLYLQDKWINPAKISAETSSKQVSCLAYSWALKVEGDVFHWNIFLWTTRHYKADSCTLHSHSC